MKNLSLGKFITIIIVIFFSFGLFIGLYFNKNDEKLALYNQYQHIVEKLLDECDATHNISDTVCEGDTYAEYMELREKLNLD